MVAQAVEEDVDPGNEGGDEEEDCVVVGVVEDEDEEGMYGGGERPDSVRLMAGWWHCCGTVGALTLLIAERQCAITATCSQPQVPMLVLRDKLIHTPRSCLQSLLHASRTCPTNVLPLLAMQSCACAGMLGGDDYDIFAIFNPEELESSMRSSTPAASQR